jgi:HTH-type transcriptional repressor of NAD biosynthesis genes
MRKPHRHALVTGKFYPPHLGHLRLIASAAAAAERVTVVVLGSSVETLTLDERVAWLREAASAYPGVRVEGVLDDLPVDYADDAVWRGHVALMREGVAAADRSDPAPPLDAVFSAEAYGHELGHRLGVTPVVLDRSKTSGFLSGTALRADLAGGWDLLPPAAQAGLVLRVAVLVAESTGTTTLCRDLAEALRRRGGAWARTKWAEEYGREFSAVRTARLRETNPAAMPKDIPWTGEDFLHIAREQTAREEAAARNGGPVLILDTDALATGVWHERYRGGRLPDLDALAASLPRRDLYVLTSPVGVDFEQDGLRDGEHLRDAMHARFREVLAGREWMEAAGGPMERVAAVLRRLDALAKRRWNFAPPLPERNKPR